MQERRGLRADGCEHVIVQHMRNPGQHHLIGPSHQASKDPTSLFLKIVSPLKLLTVLPSSRSFLRTPAFRTLTLALEICANTLRPIFTAFRFC